MQKILVVEDDFDIRELLQNFLQEAGYEVATANDGILSLVGCGRSMDDIIKNESSITGVVEEVYNNSILISIQTDAYPYGAYCDVSLDAENKDDMVDFNIGDEVIVYYDGNIAESYPLQINTVYAISLKDPAN